MRLLGTMSKYAAGVDPMVEMQTKGSEIKIVGNSEMANTYRIIPGLQKVAGLGMNDLLEVRKGGMSSPLADRTCRALTETLAHERGLAIAANGLVVPADEAKLYAELQDPTMPARGAQDPEEFKTTSYEPGA